MQDLSSVKARSVPYALQKAVDEEYDRQEISGIIEKVAYSDWEPLWCTFPNVMSQLVHVEIIQ